MIPIAISAISHFCFPTLTNFWWSVFVSLFSMVYTPLPTNIFLLGNNFFCLVARGWEDFKFLGELLYWGSLIPFLGEGGQTIFFHKAINDQSCKLKNTVHANVSHFYLGIFSLKIFCLFECPSKLSKKCLLLFGNNSHGSV